MLKRSQIPNVHVSAENTARMAVGNRRTASTKKENKPKKCAQP